MDRTRLKDDIGIEIENLERLLKEMGEIIERFGQEPDFIETRAAGSVLHDFYCGIEKIFERIAINIDEKFPGGYNWHSELLLQMGEHIEDKRERVINPVLLEGLKGYLRFRHLFRHIYGFELKWQRIKNLALSLPEVFR